MIYNNKSLSVLSDFNWESNGENDTHSYKIGVKRNADNTRELVAVKVNLWKRIKAFFNKGELAGVTTQFEEVTTYLHCNFYYPNFTFNEYKQQVDQLNFKIIKNLYVLQCRDKDLRKIEKINIAIINSFLNQGFSFKTAVYYSDCYKKQQICSLKSVDYSEMFDQINKLNNPQAKIIFFNIINKLKVKYEGVYGFNVERILIQITNIISKSENIQDDLQFILKCLESKDLNIIDIENKKRIRDDFIETIINYRREFINKHPNAVNVDEYFIENIILLSDFVSLNDSLEFISKTEPGFNLKKFISNLSLCLERGNYDPWSYRKPNIEILYKHLKNAEQIEFLTERLKEKIGENNCIQTVLLLSSYKKPVEVWSLLKDIEFPQIKSDSPEYKGIFVTLFSEFVFFYEKGRADPDMDKKLEIIKNNLLLVREFITNNLRIQAFMNFLNEENVQKLSVLELNDFFNENLHKFTSRFFSDETNPSSQSKVKKAQ